MKNTNLSLKTTCITMSGHLSTEKALFKAEIDAIRRDYAFFIEFLRNKIKFKRTGEPLC
jgi:hypothetical protein